MTCSRSEVEATDHYVCDVRDPDAVEALVTQVVADVGRLDVLVNNAGGAPYALASDASARFHDKIVGLNLLAPLPCAQAANAVMQGQDSGGAIVNISSVSAHAALARHRGVRRGEGRPGLAHVVARDRVGRRRCA